MHVFFLWMWPPSVAVLFLLPGIGNEDVCYVENMTIGDRISHRCCIVGLLIYPCVESPKGLVSVIHLSDVRVVRCPFSCIFPHAVPVEWYD